MKTYLLLTTLFISLISYTQNTAIPDVNFENYLETHDANGNTVPIGSINSMGDGIYNNHFVFTSRISNVNSLNVSNQHISDLTGIENFTNLNSLNCGINQLTVLNVSENLSLNGLKCNNNLLTALNLETNTDLTSLVCYTNQITALDLSLNTFLTSLMCNDNNLNALNVKNGNNLNVNNFNAADNIDLSCIKVDNPTYSSANWTNIDPQSTFSIHCPLGETYVPDNNFENYLETHKADGAIVPVGNANSMGNGIANDNYVTTSKIDTVTYLYVSNVGISDLTGIEAFIAIENIEASDNTITNIDLSQNIALTELDLSINFLTNLDVSNNVNLQILYCQENGITGLDLSSNTNLVELTCQDNGLTFLNVKNGNNVNFVNFNASLNLPLTCIEVDDPIWSTTNWTQIDATASFNHNCTNPETYVPDNNFESYLETHDANATIVAIGDPTSMGNGIANDDYVTTANINTVNNLDINSLSIANLTGIEDFTDLQVLNCHFNQISNIDLSQNVNLLHLQCAFNLLTNLNLSQNSLLSYLACSNNQITTLDLSNNLSLNNLYCYSNLLTSLNLNANTNLTSLDCYTNQITALDLSLNNSLVILRTQNNLLTSLTVKNGNNTNSLVFNTTNNPNLTCIEVDNTAYSIANWTNIDASSSFSAHCPLGETFVPDNNFENYLETHDANANVVAIGDPTSMGNGIANDDYVTTASINTVLNLDVNNLGIVDMTGIEDFTLLKNLKCSNNVIASLDVSQNTDLLTLNCQNNQLTYLNIDNCTLLYSVWCHNNNLTNLNLTQNTALYRLICFNNQLTSLDTSQNPVLWNFWCFNNQLTQLDLSQNPDLHDLWCYDNALTSLNIKNGHSTSISNISFNALNNPNLTCIEVDNPNYSAANWTNVDPIVNFSNDCPNLCSYPSNLNATLISATSATLDWQENGTATTWDLEIGLQGFTPTGNPTNNDINKAFIWTNGTANTDYDFYVRADCNADNTNVSLWIGPFTFSTNNLVSCGSGFKTIPNTPFETLVYGDTAYVDVDGDNDIDILTTGQKTSVYEASTKLYLNDGNGNYTEDLTTTFVDVFNSAVAFADIDNDNDQDLIITGSTLSPYQAVTKLYKNDGAGNFTLVVGTPFVPVYYSSLEFADIDNDNDQDVLINGYGSGGDVARLYVNDGLGNFTLVSGTSFIGTDIGDVSFSDVDNDNDLDVAILGHLINGQLTTDLYINDGSGNFTLDANDPFEDLRAGEIVFADLDNDNDKDVVITGHSQTGIAKSNLYINDGLGNFTLDTNSFFQGARNSTVSIADIDNDNDLDVLIIGLNYDITPSRNSRLYLNDGLGNFSFDSCTPFHGEYGKSLFIDIDNDNIIDVFILGQTKSALYKNDLIYKTEYTNLGWTNGIPNINKCAIISADYTTNSFTAYKTTVNTSKTLTIQANTFMQVQNCIDNNGTIIIEPTGSVVQTENYAKISGSGIFNTKIATTPLQDYTRFTYFSSPTKDETLNVFANWGDLTYLWIFNQYQQNWYNISDATTTMQSSLGYIVRGNPSNTYPNYTGLTTFLNKYNNGIITQNIYFKSDGSATANLDNDSNLVGNPYPSAINGTKLLDPTLNPTAGTLYFWTHNSGLVGGDFSTDDYAMWNLSGGTAAISGGTIPTGYIASGQGFFIEAEGDETLPLGQEIFSTLTFNNEMREPLNNTDFRNTINASQDKIWLNLSNNNGVFNQTLISFLPNATTNHDNAYDGKRNNNGVATFYSVGSNQQHYGIQALPLLQEDTVVPLGYQIDNENVSRLKINIDHIENMQDVTVYLNDKLLQITHNLSQSSYEFSVTETGTFDTRFELLFRSNSLNTNNITINDHLVASNLSENEILVKTATNSIISKIKVYDVLGKLIYYKNPQKSIVLIPSQNINNGTILFIKATLENGRIVTKKIIKTM